MAIIQTQPYFRPPRQYSPWERMIPQIIGSALSSYIGGRIQEPLEERRFQRGLPVSMAQAGYEEYTPGPMETETPSGSLRIGELGQGRYFRPRQAPQVTPRITPLTGGGRLLQYGDKVQYISPEKVKEWQPGVIENIKTGEQKPYTWGDVIPKGHKIVKTATTTVNIGQLKPPSPTERTDIAKGRAALDTLNNLQALFKQGFTGPIAGRVSRVKQLWGGNPQQQSEFMAATDAFKNQIIKEITGAQMSEVEAKRIMKQIPDVNDHPVVWRSKWRQTKINIEMLQARRLEVLKQSGLTVPGEQQQDPLGIR